MHVFSAMASSTPCSHDGYTHEAMRLFVELAMYWADTGEVFVAVPR